MTDLEKFGLKPYSLEPIKSKVPVAYGRNSVSDLDSSNDVATNGVNGRIGNKSWCKCECCTCTSMDTVVEGVCFLEIPEICKSIFSSTLCFYVCRSYSHFVLWYSRGKNFVGYLNSTQFWCLANQNKSFSITSNFAIIVFCKTFYYISQMFCFIRDVFLWVSFFKMVFNLIQGFCYYWKARSYRQYCQKLFTGVLEPFKNGGKIYEIHFLGILKTYLGLVSFLSTLKGCFWIFQKQGHLFLWSFLFSISHVSSSETECIAKSLFTYWLHTQAQSKNKLHYKF